jgi:hypothetical protein
LHHIYFTYYIFYARREVLDSERRKGRKRRKRRKRKRRTTMMTTTTTTTTSRLTSRLRSTLMTMSTFFYGDKERISFIFASFDSGRTYGWTDGLTKRLIEMQGCILKQLFSQHTWSSVWVEMKLGWGRGNWAGALNKNSEMTQTNQQTN